MFLEGMKMTTQERELLEIFLQQLTHTQLAQKDLEADTLIREATTKQPDANYLLVQRAMGLDIALQASQAEAAKYKFELEKLRNSSNSSLLSNASAWGRSPTSNTAFSGKTDLPMSSQAVPQRSVTSAAPASSWGSGMLGAVATTAVGVVAGSFLYNGIQSMMNDRDKSSNADEKLSSSEGNQITASNEESNIQHETNYFADAGESDFDSSDFA